MADERNSKTFDALLLLKDAGAVTADGNGTVASAAKVVNLGGALVESRVIIDVSALDLTTGDETYRLILQGCEAVGFGSGVVELGSIEVTGTGRHELHFSTYKAGTTYDYVRIRHDVGGTTPSINYTAFIAKD